MGFTSAPRFGSRVPVRFICDDVPSLSISTSNANLLLNNPAMFNVTAGTIAKIDQGVDGLNYFRGDGEYAPTTLELDWKSLGYTDYLKLTRLRPYYIHLISFRNVGYYGKIVLDGPMSGQAKTADVIQLKAKFLVLSPSDADGAVTVLRADVPSSLAVANTGPSGAGDISAALTSYYWLTFSTKYGETTSQASVGITSTYAKSKNVITWTWPVNTSQVEKASIYVSNANDINSARLIGEVPNGLAPTWVDYVGFQGTLVNLQPPLNNTAYRGAWVGGLWQNEGA